MNTVSISEIQRNLHKLDGFDIIEVVDKKRNQVKGYFLDKKYHNIIEALIKEQEAEKNRKLEALKALGSYALGGLDIKEIKASMYEDK